MSDRVMFATMVVKPGKRDEVKAAFTDMFAQAATEPGTLFYTLIEGDEPETLYFWEHYSDQGAMDTHLASPALDAVLAKIGDLISEGNAVTGTVVQKLR